MLTYKQLQAERNALHAENIMLKDEVLLARKLFRLAQNDDIFFSSWNTETSTWDEQLHLAINCNDCFAPAADAENLSYADLDKYIEVVNRYRKYGAVAWCAAKRNMKLWRWDNMENDPQYQEALAFCKQLLGEEHV